MHYSSVMILDMGHLKLPVDVQTMRNLQFNKIQYRQGKQGCLTPNFKRHNQWRR